MSNNKQLFKTEDDLHKRLWFFQCEGDSVNKDKKVMNKQKTAVVYTYASLDSLRNSITPLLLTCGLSYTHKIEKHEGKDLLTTILFNCDNKDDYLSCSTNIPEGQIDYQNQLQSLGSKLTYLKRYHLSMLLGVTTEDDNDGGSKDPSGGATYQKRAVDYEKIYSNMIDSGKTYEEIAKSFNSNKSKMETEVSTRISALIIDKFNIKK